MKVGMEQFSEGYDPKGASVSGADPSRQGSVEGADAKSEVASFRLPLARKLRFEWLWLTLIMLLGFMLRADAIRQDAAFAFNYSSQADSLETYDVAVGLTKGDPQDLYL